MPCPLGTGRVILRRLEGLYRENVAATRNRAQRLRSFASGSHYPADAASQVPPLRVNAVRAIRLGSDRRRLQRPVWDWSPVDLAEWAFRFLEHPGTAPPVLSPAEQLRRVVGRRGQTRERLKDSVEDASINVRPGGVSSRGTEAQNQDVNAVAEEAHDEPGESEKEGEEETTSDAQDNPETQNKKKEDEEENGTNEPSLDGIEPPPGLPDGQSHQEPPAPAWSSVEPFSGTEWGTAVSSWSSWLETTGMRGRHASMLTRHGSGDYSLRWLWQRVGATPKARRLLAQALVQRCLEDGSNDRAKRAETLPLVHVVEVDVSGSAEMRVVGEVTVQTSDSFATVRERVRGMMHSSGEGAFPFDDDTLQFLGGQTFRPVLRAEEPVWKPFATGFAVFVTNSPQGEAVTDARPPTEDGGPRPPVPGRETLRGQLLGDEDASPHALLADAVPST